MARTDAMVLGAGTVGTSIALHLAKRGLSVALVDRGGVGEETSYGNAGIIEGNTVFPPAFPSDPAQLLRIALKRATEANYHLSFLPQIAPWLLAYRAATRPDKLVENARLVRPFFGSAVAEHEALLAESGGSKYLRKNGWLKLYRSEKSFAAMKREFDMAAALGLPLQTLETGAVLAMEPSLKPVFSHAVFWPSGGKREQPARRHPSLRFKRFAALGGITLKGNALTAASRRRPLAGGDGRGPARRKRGRRCARALGARFARSDGPQAADGGQARLSPALPRAG